MTLLDVHNTAIQECQDASQLILDTNEFYNNRIESNGTTYSSAIHSCVIDRAFLSLFEALEYFLDESFICYMMGEHGLNGKSFTRFVSPQNEVQARNILRGINHHTDFTNRDTIVKLANNFFDGGGTYSYLDTVSADFEEMKKIRNAISHVSDESTRAFQGVVRTRLGSLPPNMTTSTFLNSTVPNETSTFFIHYRDIVECIIDNISNPNQ